MRVLRTSEVPEEPATSPIFTGTVTRQMFVSSEEANNFACGAVNFSKGSRNKFHAHTSDQVLIITAGIGIVADAKAEREVTVGDVIHIPAGEKHWHGARKESYMSHITITSKDSETDRDGGLVFVKQIRVESLGNSSYLVGSQETKVCAVVDPLRDVDMYIHEADVLGVRITHALETHVHNDFISGSRELVARTGATSLFSGGALLVGGVARTDMMGKQLAPFLGRWFHRTIRHELQGLDDRVAVYPTHGGGSFCMAASSGSSETTSTIGQERMANPFFQAETEADFLELASGNMPSYPAYYKRMANINRRGPPHPEVGANLVPPGTQGGLGPDPGGLRRHRRPLRRCLQ